MNFTDFSKSSYGFEKAYNSFKDQEEKFFNFLIYFEGKTLAECYKNSEIPLNCLKAIINAFKDKDISNKYKDGYCLVFRLPENHLLIFSHSAHILVGSLYFILAHTK